MNATAVLLQERAELCDTMEQAGPDAPTLCEGWRTIDLAAHLVAREARSDAAVGLVLPGPFARHLQHVMDRYKERGYERLVAMLRTGPPWMHRHGPLATANVNENFIHHEDVRRASGEPPRELGTELDAVLWRMLGFGARLARRHLKDAHLVLRTLDGRECVVSKTGAPVTLTGTPGELTLFMAGRKEAAEVTHEGDPTAIAIVMAADFGV
ncbi:MAG TPA: TIGR03085 family metal-binding protein [Acidimicrobiia bacterium]|nr:TIGR03085 family metal-binding protein [Acidimicrobiia bacterium]